MDGNALLIPHFEKTFRARLPGIEYSRIEGPPVRFVVPAKSEEFGPIEASMDGDEVTVYAGRWHHCHFGAYQHSCPTKEESLQAAAEGAVDFIKDLIEDKVYVKVYHAFDRVLGSASGYKPEDGGLYPTKCRFVDTFTWSGRISRQDRPSPHA
jgi:hypothetical protein